MSKTFNKSEKIFDREIEIMKDLPKPNVYKEFINEIAKSFNIKNKKQI